LTADTDFAEIEVDFSADSRKAGDGEQRFSSVTAAQTIEQKAADPIRTKFYQMRSLASVGPITQNKAELFYRQARFMENFSDDFRSKAPFSMYYPHYQHMGYEQLRSYFTWRSMLRRGEAEAADVSLSYLYLYLYELLSCVGADSPEEGLDKLMQTWNAFRVREPSLDAYLPSWLRDYHIYYILPHSFAEFIEKYNLQNYYPSLFLFDPDAKDSLALWSSIANYDVAKSRFYAAGNEILLRDCFRAVLERVRELCESRHVRLEELFTYSISDETPWSPFHKALFYPWYRQPNRQLEMPGRETYYCRNNRWTMIMPIPYAGRKELAGYLIRKTEACLREITHFRFALTTDPGSILRSQRRLHELRIPLPDLDDAVEKAVTDFHKGLSRVIVTVGEDNLARIRSEAQITQDRLSVPEEESPVLLNGTGFDVAEAGGDIAESDDDTAAGQLAEAASGLPETDGWSLLNDALSATERRALSIALQGGAGMKAFADEQGVMLEVLADRINEKAADCIGDSILESADSTKIYDEYREQIAKIVGR